MVNFVITTFTTTTGDIDTVTALMETQMETIDNAQTVFLYDVFGIGNEIFKGVIVTGA